MTLPLLVRHIFGIHTFKTISFLLINSQKYNLFFIILMTTTSIYATYVTSNASVADLHTNREVPKSNTKSKELETQDTSAK